MSFMKHTFAAIGLVLLGPALAQTPPASTAATPDLQQQVTDIKSVLP